LTELCTPSSETCAEGAAAGLAEVELAVPSTLVFPFAFFISNESGGRSHQLAYMPTY
jgi:hypothetical protein